MSFPIILQRNLSPLIKVDKDITNIATATGTLRSSSSIIDPVIEIQSALESDILAYVNYAYIELWHRYYIITNIEMDINGLWVISMHVDVLMSYKTEIRAQNAVIARQERRYNMYLDDGWFMSYQNPIVQKQRFSVTAPFENHQFILVLAGS